MNISAGTKAKLRVLVSILKGWKQPARPNPATLEGMATPAPSSHGAKENKNMKLTLAAILAALVILGQALAIFLPQHFAAFCTGIVQ